MIDIKRQNLKVLVRGVYDCQKLRIQMGNRIVGNFKAKLGQEGGSKEEDLEQLAQDLLKEIRQSYNKITDASKRFPTIKTFKPEGVISNYTELCLINQYFSLESDEKKHFYKLESILQDYPIYETFLKDVRGCGPAMSAVIISEIDIHKARHSSSLWKYAGLDVAEDGRGRGRFKEHLIDQKYFDKEGIEKEKKSITFNPFLKTKLVGVLGSCFLRAGDNPYRQIYLDTKNRLENHIKYKEASLGHRHHMAIRKMIKIFLIDLYTHWRPLEGLEVSKPYHEAKLGLVHGEDLNNIVTHIDRVNHIVLENHKIKVGHRAEATQTKLANQNDEEDHTDLVNHDREETHARLVSQNPEESYIG